jgi:predicted AAA+ superfamily ATPase
MNKKIQLNALSAEEQRRLVEIKMYVIIEHIFKVMGDKTTTYDMLDAICSASDTSIVLIKSVISNMRAANSQIAPSGIEIAVMFYRHNYSVSRICSILDISPNTVYNYLRYVEHREGEYLPRIKTEYYSQVEKFTKLLGELFNDEYRIQ